MVSKRDNNEGLRLIEKIKLIYIKEIIEELKKDPKLTSHMAKEEDLSPNDYITYTSTPDKNISYYDSTLKKIYTLKIIKIKIIRNCSNDFIFQIYLIF